MEYYGLCSGLLVSSPHFIFLFQVTNYLLNEILKLSTVASRAEILKYLLICGFISIETMNNFDLVVLIQGVLERTPIYRLKLTWERVEKMIPNKRMEFKKLVGICGKNVGTLMNKSVPPMIPYLGTIMQWIMNNHEIPSLLPQTKNEEDEQEEEREKVKREQRHDKQEDKTDTSSQGGGGPHPDQESIMHLNISKHRHLAMIIQTFENGQKIPYTIDNDLKIQKIVFQPIQWAGEETIQLRSVELEPIVK
jgi:hypothetical protein